MAGSTISGTVGVTVTLGSAAYPSPLTITSTGDVAVTVAGATGVYAPTNAGSLINAGTIIGGAGPGSGISEGGDGVLLRAGNAMTNAGTIIGGAGQGVEGGTGADGGIGVVLLGSSTLTNTATIIGGQALLTSAFMGGRGGYGVDLQNGSVVVNDGSIAGGGGGGSSADNGGNGGTGVGLRTSGTLINDASGVITGGVGYASIGPSGHGGNGGSGVFAFGGVTVTNAGIIAGGGGGSGGGIGGSGLALLAGALLTNSGRISGGEGGYGGGVGGYGVLIDQGAAVGTITNTGIITGGAGGAGAPSPGAATGYGGYGVIIRSGTLTNAGTILGGVDGRGLDMGGDGVFLSSGTGDVVVNTGSIGGASGGFYSSGEPTGGAGIVESFAGSADTVINSGRITGGNGADPAVGQSGSSYSAFAGGAGAQLSAGNTLINSGDIIGGAGLSLGAGDMFTNQNVIVGGAGVEAVSGATFIDSGTVIGGVGVYLAASATLMNNGSINGGIGYGVSTGSGVAFYSTVLASGGAGVSVATGDTLINIGNITGGDGVSIAAGASFRNRSSIFGGAGVTVASGGTLINSGIITPGVGVYVAPGGTLTNAGTIAGGVYGAVTADAVLFGGAGTLVVYGSQGGNFIGQVVGDAAADDVLILQPAGATNTLSGLGTQIVNFVQTTVDGAWTLTGANTVETGTTLIELAGATLTDTGTLVNQGGIVLDPSTLVAGALTGTGSVTIAADSTLLSQGVVSSGQTLMFRDTGGYIHLYDPDAVTGTITNFVEGESIDLKGINPTSVSYAAGQLMFTGGSFSLDLGVSGTIAATASSDGAVVTVICFCANAQILTPEGERAVQDLAVGDQVVTRRGEAREIMWIGAGKVPAARGQRSAATPVIVRKGAFAENVPNRDLRVTKGHAFWFDGVLIPVEFLVNHRLIEWDDHAQEVELYHIELATHDVLIANGAPAESYRDDGNRWLFRNANSGWDLPPQRSCAPVLTGGPVVDAIWRRLLDRAGPRPGFAFTDNPDLHLRVDGERVNATSRYGTVYVFDLPSGCTSVQIVSNAAAPAELGVARDPRVLGVAVRRVALRQGTRFHVVKAADATLTDGFHPFEPDSGLRWTDGDATLPPALFAAFQGPIELVLHVGATTAYPLIGPAASSIAA